MNGWGALLEAVSFVFCALCAGFIVALCCGLLTFGPTGYLVFGTGS